MVLLYPITTERSIGMIELQNKIVFAIEEKATKKQVKEEVEKTFKVKVEKVTIMITPKGQKRAFVRLKEGYNAEDIAAKLKIT